MSLPYTKMSGAGNTFIVIEERCLPEGTDPGPLAPTLCADGQDHGGADGLIVIARGHRENYFTMKYYNRDGSAGMMCGNGGRCAALYAVENGIVVNDEPHVVNAGIVYPAAVEMVSREGEPAPTKYNHVQLWFPNPRRIELDLDVDILGRSRRCHFIDVGTPHVIMFVDELGEGLTTVDDIDIMQWGPTVRNHERFAPEGANVNFVEVVPTDPNWKPPTPPQPGEHRIVSSYDPPVIIRLRTYERGVEAETGACGTGAIASALATALKRRPATDVDVITTSGARLEVGWGDDEDIEPHAETIHDPDRNRIMLGGDAIVVSEGEFSLAW
jgi:diaminopimelate epimerase